MDKESFRFYTKMRIAPHIQPTIIHDELCPVFGDEARSFRTVVKWSQYFREGREEINDEKRSGRPITAITSENAEEIQSSINHNLYFTIEELQDRADLSHGTIHL